MQIFKFVTRNQNTKCSTQQSTPYLIDHYLNQESQKAILTIYLMPAFSIPTSILLQWPHVACSLQTVNVMYNNGSLFTYLLTST